MTKLRLSYTHQLAVAGLLTIAVLIAGLPAGRLLAQQPPPAVPAPVDGVAPPAPTAGGTGDTTPAAPPPEPAGSAVPPEPAGAAGSTGGDSGDLTPLAPMSALTPGTELVAGSGLPGDPLGLPVDPISDIDGWLNVHSLLFGIEQTHNEPFSTLPGAGFAEPEGAAQLEATLSPSTASPIAAVLLAQAHQARLAAQPPPRPDSDRNPPPTGPLTTATVRCPPGGTITVAAHIAPWVQQLLDAANTDGVALCGWGYRSTTEQIELRRQHCGSSDYAIYQMPSSQCTPPTARPGSSMHERGEAIDFSNCSRTTRCFQWLSQHADDFGLYNLPSESWHWSSNGR